ncbi:Integrase core domain-containing protein, partial [Pseudovibrio axinellae]
GFLYQPSVWNSRLNCAWGRLFVSSLNRCNRAYQRLLSRHKITPSMSGKGNCFDNSMVETEFKAIKSERLWRTTFQTRQKAEKALGLYIDDFYNPIRRHSSLGYQSPIAFERQKRNSETEALHFLQASPLKLGKTLQLWPQLLQGGLLLFEPTIM